MNSTLAFWDLTPAEVGDRLLSMGLPDYRAKQVLHWAYERLVTDYDGMTDLPAGLRARLTSELPMPGSTVVAEQCSADGSTRKVLLRLEDGNTVEAVLMQYDPTDASRGRETICVSTQVGCAMGCTFCATGQQGFLRNLRPGEIIQQVLHFARELREKQRRVTNVVFMGMGEPLANYEALMKSIEILRSPEAFGLGARRITVSTVGLVPMIRRLAAEGLQIGLAVSLHTPDDEQRRKLVPTASASISQILSAADEYAARTGRRYTIEYALIERSNDWPELAQRLASLLKGRSCHVNLIPVNPTANQSTRRSPRQRVLTFERLLREAGVTTTVRVEKGVDIAAGCGQLRGATSGRKAAPALAILPAV